MATAFSEFDADGDGRVALAELAAEMQQRFAQQGQLEASLARRDNNATMLTADAEVETELGYAAKCCCALEGQPSDLFRDGAVLPESFRMPLVLFRDGTTCTFLCFWGRGRARMERERENQKHI